MSLRLSIIRFLLVALVCTGFSGFGWSTTSVTPGQTRRQHALHEAETEQNPQIVAADYDIEESLAVTRNGYWALIFGLDRALSVSPVFTVEAGCILSGIKTKNALTECMRNKDPPAVSCQSFCC